MCILSCQVITKVQTLFTVESSRLPGQAVTRPQVAHNGWYDIHAGADIILRCTTENDQVSIKYKTNGYAKVLLYFYIAEWELL